VWNNNYRYEWAFTAREAIDNVWNNGAWIEGEETRDDYTILIARDDNNHLTPCHFHTLFNRYE